MAIPCDSTITHVHVFARGAHVTRRVTPTGALADGDVTLAIDGLPTLAAPGSFRVRLADEAADRTLVLVRSTLVVPTQGTARGPAREAVHKITSRIRRLNSRERAIRQRRDAVAAARLSPDTRARRMPDHPRAIGPRTGETLATHAMLAVLAADLDARLDAIQREQHELNRALDRARADAAQARSSQLMGDARPTRRVLITVRGTGPLPSLELTYAVDAARWWPVYTLRIRDNARAASWVSEALVAQRSGEDWRDVRLELSTADMLFDARLPTLPSLRFGRAQPPPKHAWRPPPLGIDAMFGGYDRAFREAVPAIGMATIMTADHRAEEVDDDLAPVQFDALAQMPTGFASPSKTRAGGPPMGAPSPVASNGPPRAKRMAMPATKSAGLLASALSFGGGGGASMLDGAAMAPEPELALEPSDAWLDYDGLLLGAPEDGGRRGRLGRDPHNTFGAEKGHAVGALDGLSPLPGVVDPRASRGMFDHRYRAEGIVEVPSDGLSHRVPLGAGDATPTVRWRTIPCERPEVFREVELRNPFDAPLLAGPVDVYVDGSLLVVASIERIDRGGTLRVGMGVDERLRVARNVRAKEDTAGLLGGDTTVDHTVTIELASALGSPALVEVVDRVPVSDEKAVEVSPRGARPDPERFTQAERGAAVRGGLRWEVIVPAGARSSVEFSYRVTLPSKNELVGGNRRG